MALAFTGIRIIDFTQVLAGPFATQQLAQLGADVIKIEQPGSGDQTRGLLSDADNGGMSPSFLTCNLGKRSMTLNLKAPAAGAIVRRLVANADVVVENFKPGVMARLGLGYEELRAARPDLIYCSISGYGQAGPKSPLAAYDGAIQAASGMMAITGHPETGPVRTGYMPVDLGTALNSAFAISAALYRRLATGEGQRVDVAMMDTAMVLQAPQVSNFLVEGVTPPLFGNRSPTRQPTANVFATADGFVQIIALKEPQVKLLLAVTGLSDCYDRPEWSSPEARIENTDLINATLCAEFAKHPTAYWAAAAQEAGLPAAEIRDFDAVVADPQFEHRQAFTEIPKPGAPGQTTQVVSIGFVAQPDSPRVASPPPSLGEHTEEVLGQIGYSQGEIAQFRADGVV